MFSPAAHPSGTGPSVLRVAEDGPQVEASNAGPGTSKGVKGGAGTDGGLPLTFRHHPGPSLLPSEKADPSKLGQDRQQG